MSFSIALDKSPTENIQSLMQERINHCRQALQNEKHPHKAIHQARKELKKVRAIVRLVRLDIGQEAYAKTNAYFRDIARKLSAARDASAVLDTLYDLEARLTTKKDQALLQKIKRHLGAKKAAVTRYQINGRQVLPEAWQDLQQAEHYIEAMALQHEDFNAFQPGIRKVYGRCRKGLKHAYALQTPEAFHQWRKRVKYLRYQLDILTPLWPQPLTVLEDELHTLSDYLGDEHDLTVFKEQVQAMPNHAAQDSVFAAMDAIKQTLQQAARPLGHKLFYLKPAAFTGWLETCWKQSLPANAKPLTEAALP